MRKKINVRDLIVGMYVDEIVGSWLDHGFWKTSFKLTGQKEIVDLQRSSIAEVWIDTSKGLDVVAAVHADAEPVASAAVQVAVEKAPVRVPLDQELERAKKLQSRAKQAVISLFGEARMGKALPIEEMGSLVEDIHQSVSRNSSALISLLRLKNKDDYTYLHSVSVCALMIALGKQMGVAGNELQSLGLAGLLHDIGKVAIPGEVLNKPGHLTDSEFDEIKMHPVHGWEMLGLSGVVDSVALDVCRHHHERTDGTGYPDRLSGDALTLHARMGAVCDIYDAMTSDRCYKKAWEPTEALRSMAKWQKGHLDEKVFQHFIKTVGIYPVGTLLKLKSGRLAVVTDQTDRSLLEPIVRVFFSTRSNAPIAREIINLGLSQDAVASVQSPAEWGLDLRRLAGVQ